MLGFCVRFSKCQTILGTSTNLVRYGQNNSMRKFVPILAAYQRLVHLEVPDEENEKDIRLDNFEEIYPNLKLPYKLQHPEHKESSKEFIKLRITQYPKRMETICVEDYKEIYEHLNANERDIIVNEIEMVVAYYNRILSKSIFCPSSIPVADMRKILTDYNSYNARIRYLHFLFVREFDIWRLDLDLQKKKQESKRKEEEELASFSDIGCFDSLGQIQYGFWRNTLFSRYFQRTRSKYSLHNLRQAELFSQKIVIDCSFDETMADYETISVARQISAIYHTNRFSSDPFNLLFCGFRESNRGYQHAAKLLKSIIDDPQYFFNLRKETYQELLGGERLIYLSPDSRKLMTEFDSNAVYIIGALVSKTQKSSYTYEKAKEEGIECLRLPIHEHVELKPGVKRVLSFQGVFKILLELKQHGNWEKALRAGILPHKLTDGNMKIKN